MSFFNLVDGTAGTVTGRTLTTDRFGNSNSAYSFNGSSNYINTNKNILSTAHQIHSFNIWAKRSNTGVYIRFGGNFLSSIGYYFQITAANKVFASCYSTSSNYGNETNATFTDTSNWHMYTFVKNTTRNYQIYVDGVEYTTTFAGNGSDDFSTPANFYIGIIPETLNQYGWNGLLGEAMIFNKTLSADEVKQLYQLTSQDYIYPAPSYDLSNLREGLVLDLNEQGKDLSGNGNHGTLVNSPTVVRQGKAKGLSYNGSNQYINCPSTSFNSGGTNIFSSNHIVSFTSTTSNRSLLMGTTTGTGILVYYTANQLVFSKPNVVDLIISFTPVIGKIYNITCIANSSGMKIYIDGVLVGSNTNTSNFTNTTSTIGIGAYILGGVVQNSFYLQGNMFRTRIRNRALSPTEIQQLYYSQKGSFVY